MLNWEEMRPGWKEIVTTDEGKKALEQLIRADGFQDLHF